LAQSDDDHKGYMKTVVLANASMQRNLIAKNGRGAAADAQRVETGFKGIEEFWQRRKAANAVGFAKQARTAAAAVAKAATAGNLDAASAAAKTMAPSCAGCHTAHRAQGESGFTIK